MAEERSKIGYGNSTDIDTAIANKLLNTNDLIITKDTSELVFLALDGKKIVKSRVSSYESESDAITAINTATDTYVGEPVSIKNANTNKYEPYTVQANSDAESSNKFVVEPVSVGLTITEF